jgi:hypothetical protein
MDFGNGYDGAGALAIFWLIYGIMIGLIFLSAIVVYVLMGFSFMKLFRKVGVEPWAAWVPIFNVWRILELGGQPGWISVLAVINGANIVTVVFECIAAYRIGIAFRKEGGWVALFIFLPYVWAWVMASDGMEYEPGLLAARGYGPPLVGYGSARGPYVAPANPATPAA